MMNVSDLKYLCTNLSSLVSVPVRLYEKDELAFYSSVVNLLKDPFEIDKEEAFKLKDDITYYQSTFYYYYGLINYQDYKIVVGPTSQIKPSKQDLKAIAFSLGIPISYTDEFVSQMESLVSYPLMSLLQILCMINFSITGEKKTLQDITIHESKQEEIISEMGKQGAERTVEEQGAYANGPYNALDIENRLIDMVMRGDVAALNDFFNYAPAVRSGTIAQEDLRQNKNIFIVTATLVSRAAIRGGMDVTAALVLSDMYIQKCELNTSSDGITDLSYRMVLDYAEKVAAIKLGQNPSQFVIKVSNYIQQHLSEPIKVEDIAAALYMGRSRLSTNFKKETGFNLSHYIVSMKIDEAKRLLRYSNKPFSLISAYLGFSSQSHFSKVFKQYTDTTPFEYRQLQKHY